jgi:hypothetical protein
MKYLTILLLTFQIGFSQKLILNDTLGKNSDTIKVGNKVKLSFYSAKMIKMGQFLKFDGDKSTYHYSAKILAIDSANLVVKYRKDSLKIPLENIYAIRKVYSGNRILARLAINTPISLGLELLFFSAIPVLSFETLGVFIITNITYRVLEPYVFRIRKFKTKRYSLVYIQ